MMCTYVTLSLACVQDCVPCLQPLRLRMGAKVVARHAAADTIRTRSGQGRRWSCQDRRAGATATSRSAWLSPAAPGPCVANAAAAPAAGAAAPGWPRGKSVQASDGALLCSIRPKKLGHSWRRRDAGYVGEADAAVTEK